MLLLAAAALLNTAAPLAAPATPAWPIEDLAGARAAATVVAVAYVDFASQPRGKPNACGVAGRLVKSERGAIEFGDWFQGYVPCAENPAGQRWVAQSAMHAGGYARVYLDANGALLDYQPLELIKA